MSENPIREALRFLRHGRAAGFGEARRRLREKREDREIRTELERKDFLTAEERAAQEKEAGAEEIRFVVVPLRKAVSPQARAVFDRSLEEQIWRNHRTADPEGVRQPVPGARDGSSADSAAREEEYLVFAEPDSFLHPGALLECARVIRKTGADLLYADEDWFIDAPKDVNRPHFKPDYGPESLECADYIGPFLVCRPSLLRKAGNPDSASPEEAERWAAALSLAKAARRVEHIPKVLYYRRTSSEAAIPLPAVRRDTEPLPSQPLVSVLIPSCDHREDLLRCVNSIRDRSTYPAYEILILENNSREEETFRAYRELEKDPRVRVISVPQEGAFNYSAVNNAGFRQAKGEQILLLNNDTEVLSPDWLQEMLRYALREGVGAVGAKLLYPDGTIQHAGIGVGVMMLAGHLHRGFPGNSPGYWGRLSCAQNVSAVTGACMMIPRRVYEETGGLDESFRLVFNDIDLCLRMREKGYRLVWTPWAQLTHYESKSRGADEDTPEKKAFFVRETNRFLRRWYKVLEAGDPCYNRNLTRWKEDFSLR